jgi:hypothetical protein
MPIPENIREGLLVTAVVIVGGAFGSEKRNERNETNSKTAIASMKWMKGKEANGSNKN